MITRKFIGLFLAGIILIILLGFFFNPLNIFIAVNIVIAALLAADIFILKKNIRIFVARTGTNKLEADENSEISFFIRNDMAKPVTLKLIGQPPFESFEIIKNNIEAKLMPGEGKIISYIVKPLKRGIFQFNSLQLEFLTPFGLAKYYLEIINCGEYKVYPNTRKLKKYLSVSYKTKLENSADKTIKIRSKGTSFESLRDYVYGDVYKDINWKATARKNKLIINQYEPEKNQRIYAFLDAGRPMAYKIKGKCRFDTAIETLLVLNEITNKNGDLFGTYAFDTEIRSSIKLNKGPVHRRNIMEAFYRIQPVRKTSCYEKVFLKFTQEEKRKSLIYIFTDFDTLEEAEILAFVAKQLKNHIVIIVLLKDKSIEKITEKKCLTEQDMFNKASAHDTLSERRKGISYLNSQGLLCIEGEPETIEMACINKYIELKNQLSGI